MTVFWGFKDSIENETENVEQKPDDISENRESKKEAMIKGFVCDNVIPLSEVADEVFATEQMGPEVAIIPTSDKFFSPIDGTVTMIFPTKHAIALRHDNGLEMLLHIGLDTVKLDCNGILFL